QTPVQALKKWHEEKPDLFLKRVYNQAGLDTYAAYMETSSPSEPTVEAKITGLLAGALSGAVARWMHRDENVASQTAKSVGSSTYDGIIAARRASSATNVAPMLNRGGNSTSGPSSYQVGSAEYNQAVRNGEMEPSTGSLFPMDANGTEPGLSYLEKLRAAPPREPISLLPDVGSYTLPVSDTFGHNIADPMWGQRIEAGQQGSGMQPATVDGATDPVLLERWRSGYAHFASAELSRMEDNADLELSQRLARAQFNIGGEPPVGRREPPVGRGESPVGRGEAAHAPGFTKTDGTALETGDAWTPVGPVGVTTVPVGTQMAGGDIHMVFDRAGRGGYEIPDDAGVRSIFGGGGASKYTYQDALAAAPDHSQTRLDLLKFGAETWGVGGREYAEQGMAMYPDDPQYRDFLNRANGLRDSMKSVAITSAIGTAGLLTGGYAFSLAEAGGISTAGSYYVSGVVGDLTVQGLNLASGQQKSFSAEQLALSSAFSVAAPYVMEAAGSFGARIRPDKAFDPIEIRTVANADSGASSMRASYGPVTVGPSSTQYSIDVVGANSPADAAAAAANSPAAAAGENSLTNKIGFHPDSWAAVNGQVNAPSVMRALRQSGTTEGAAVAKLLKRGDLKLELSDEMPTIPQGGLMPMGGDTMVIFKYYSGSPAQTAGLVAHEGEHFLQKMTPEQYANGPLALEKELAAYSVQRWVDKSFFLRTDQEAIEYLVKSPLYPQINQAAADKFMQAGMKYSKHLK
ncbi:hypothetical protein, partial [Massilia antarctica]|uniref:hypothetical protein n=1 Tax=Massilia antarctica TaxID=2765360 RepID=UPI0035E587E8